MQSPATYRKPNVHQDEGTDQSVSSLICVQIHRLSSQTDSVDEEEGLRKSQTHGDEPCGDGS